MRVSTRREEGFTIQEVLLTIVIGALIVSSGVSLFLFAKRVTQTWGERIEQQTTVHGVLNTMLTDSHRSERFLSASDSSLLFQLANGDTIRYDFSRSGPLRNEVPMFGPNPYLRNIQLKPFSGFDSAELTVGASGKELYSARTVLTLRSSAKRLFTKDGNE